MVNGLKNLTNTDLKYINIENKQHLNIERQYLVKCQNLMPK